MMRLGWRLVGMIAPVVIGGACADAPTAPAREPVKPAAATASRTLTLEGVQGVGCAVATQTATGTYGTIVRRTALPVRLPTAVAATQSERISLRAVPVALTAPAAGGARFTVTCIVPATVKAESLYALLGRGKSDVADKLWAALGRPDSVYPANVDVITAASRTLNGALAMAGARFRTVSKHEPFQTAPLRSAGISMSLDGTLPPIVVRADPDPTPTPRVSLISSSYWSYVDASQLWSSYMSMYFMGFFDFSYAQAECAAAVDTYLNDLAAMEQELAVLQADVNAYDAKYQSVMSQAACERRTDQKTKCVDLFISGCTIGGIGLGDCRQSDPNAPYSMSRVQMYFDFDNLDALAYINRSTIRIPLLSGQSLPISSSYPLDLQTFKLTRLDASNVMVEFGFYNGFCDDAMNILCPAINGVLRFTRGAEGKWALSQYARDHFPTMDIFQQEPDGRFVSEFNDQERKSRDLFTRWQTIEEWRRRISDVRTLPPNCNLY